MILDTLSVVFLSGFFLLLFMLQVLAIIILVGLRIHGVSPIRVRNIARFSGSRSFVLILVINLALGIYSENCSFLLIKDDQVEYRISKKEASLYLEQYRKTQDIDFQTNNLQSYSLKLEGKRRVNCKFGDDYENIFKCFLNLRTKTSDELGKYFLSGKYK